MYVSRVSGAGCPALRRVSPAGLFLALALTAGAASAADNSAFVSYAGVPTTMAPKSTAVVTVTMLNDGTTWWPRPPVPGSARR